MIFKISSEKIEEFIEKQHAIDGMVFIHDFELWLEEQPRVGQWIPCSEPPKYTGDYLVTVGINRYGFGMYDEVRTANYNTVYEKWTVHEDWENAIGTNPIAWMPLPKPYKEGESS